METCKFHAAEAVTTCGWCEAPMCKECVDKSFITRAINGQPTCYTCSVKHVEDDKGWLKRCKFALIFGGSVWAFVIVSFFVGALALDSAHEDVFNILAISWFLLLLVTGFFLARISKLNEDIINETSEGWKDDDKITRFFKMIKTRVIRTIIYTVISPIALIVYLIKYYKNKKQFGINLQDLQKYKEIIPADMQ